MRPGAFLNLLLLSTALMSGAASAVTMTFTGGSGGLASSATFTQSGNDLYITLTNTGAAATVPADVLTGVYFSLTGSLTKDTATLTAGSTVLNSAMQPAGGNVGGEFAYATGINKPTLAGATVGISSSGLGIFGPDDRFDVNSNLAGPAEPDGLQYGIVSAIAANANPAVNGTPLIQSAVLFHFLVSNDFSFGSINNLYFQYGTALSEPSFGGACTAGICSSSTGNNIPEPAMLILLSIGLLGVAFMRRRKALHC